MSDGDALLENFLEAMTVEEKVSLLAGKNMWETVSIPRLGIPSLKMTDGPAGARGSKWTGGSHTTFIPCGTSLAATFDPALVQRVGALLAREAKSKGCHVLLAPTMNLSRSPLGGRNFESYGEDPFLIGTMAAGMIKGIQNGGVGACMKHFIANDTETRRFNVDEQIDMRSMREVYMKPFHMCLKEDPWTAMASYPKINGVHADTSSWLIDGILRREWGYQNLVMSDWGGCNHTVNSLLATLDLEMPGPAMRRGAKLLEAIRKGEVQEDKHIDPSVRRLLQLLRRAGLLPADVLNTPDHVPDAARGDDPEAQESGLNDEWSQQLCREAARNGLVLLKNKGILPITLNALKKVAIIGPNAKSPIGGGGGSAAVNPFYMTTPYDSIRAVLDSRSPETEVVYEPGISTNLQPPLLGGLLKTPDRSRKGWLVDYFKGTDCKGDVVGQTYWSDSLVFPMSDGEVPASLVGKECSYQAKGIVTPSKSGTYVWSIANTGKAKLFVDGKVLIDNTEWKSFCNLFQGCSSQHKTAEMVMDAGREYQVTVSNAVVMPSMERLDNTLFDLVSGMRVGLQLKVDEGAAFDRAVQQARDSDLVIVVVGHSKDSEGEGGDRSTIHLPGRSDQLVESICSANAHTVVVVQSGSAIAMPWAGHSNANAIVHAWYQGQENGNALADVLFGDFNFTGKLPITFPLQLEDHGTYPWFPADANDYAVYGEGILFGYRHFDAQDLEPLWPFGFGLSYTQFQLSNVEITKDSSQPDTLEFEVKATVSNTGIRDGDEVVQVYLSAPPEIAPRGLTTFKKTLVGFCKVSVPHAESRDVSISVGKGPFQWFDPEKNRWQVGSGDYQCSVGTSSRHIHSVLDIHVD